ncbi:MAG TPA: ATP-binding protein, partial [Myxococcota bacterium]|nr:ATP-binding protein [Myxococcota bacterium]
LTLQGATSSRTRAAIPIPAPVPVLDEPAGSGEVSTPAPLPKSRSWIRWFAYTGLLLAAGGVAFHRYRQQLEEAPAEPANPFRPITLTPMRKGQAPGPRRPDPVPASRAGLQQVVGTAPRTPPPAPVSSAPAEQFIYAAAHDLQEPLRKIRSFTERLNGKIQTAGVQDGQGEIQSIRSTLGRMQGMLDSLLSLARIQGRGALFETVPLGEVIQGVLADLDERVLETHAVVRVEGTPPELAGDRTQLQQLITNLLANALKFHAPGEPPQVTLRVSVIEDQPVNGHETDRSWCELVVEDRGIGFEQSSWERLVEGFHRLNPRDQYPGTGLGLAICRSIVDRHGGTITGRSAPGQGTAISIRLPIRQYARSGDTAVLIAPRTTLASALQAPPPTDPAALRTY